MIVSIRVDDRLIHGQVALVWSKEFGISRIVVANDDAATNEIQQTTLRMATPTGIKLLVKSVKDSIKVFNNPKAKDVKLFVLTNCVADALEIVKSCSDIQSVNVANVGRFDNSDPDKKVKLNSNIFLNEKELKALQELVEYSVPVYHQVIPSSPQTPIKNLIDNIKRKK